ncbi:hypothetical protein E2C01_090182 [Portunus trituberculatus]|uniref:Uncharacterized protein n=1 Tax=Portunus trituberculatus TaxID=210409 RepID=A0A5B7JE04_PORTR|nr:hypothetical protein [Portunus trituberculatus]
MKNEKKIMEDEEDEVMKNDDILRGLPLWEEAQGLTGMSAAVANRASINLLGVVHEAFRRGVSGGLRHPDRGINFIRNVFMAFIFKTCSELLLV